ncbi:MAG: hypothetical protein HEQ15_01755 [Betaproteobacteria bacterium]
MGLPSAAQVSRAQFHVDCDQSRIRQTNLRFYAMKRIKRWAQFGSTRAGRFYKPAAWANFAPAVLAVHWVRVPRLPNPSARTSPARDGFEKFPILRSTTLTSGLVSEMVSDPHGTKPPWH